MSNIKRIFIVLCFLIIFARVDADFCPVSSGGTGLSAISAYSVLCGGTNSTGALQTTGYTGIGSGLQALTSAGAGALPSFLPLKEFAYIYINTGAGPTVTAGSAILFTSNKILSSGISHSTSSNTDQIIINRAGTYLIIYQANTSVTQVALALTVDGAAAQAESKIISSSASGGPICGQCILTFTAGQVLRVINFSASSMTISTNRVGASVTLMQIN
jgi:hypothetical protein